VNAPLLKTKGRDGELIELLEDKTGYT